MKVSDIRHSAEMYCGKSIEDDMAINVVNECLDIIADLSDLNDEESIEVTDVSVWHELPENTTRIVNVTSSDGSPYKNWQSRGNTLKFSDLDTYSVLVKRMPEHVESMSEEPDCHVMFHRLLGMYLRGYAKLATEDTNADGQQAIQRFYEEIQRVAEVLRTTRQR